MINERRLVNAFLEIVQIDSPTGHEAKMVDYVLGLLNSLDIENKKDSYGNIIAKIEGHGSFRDAEPLLLTAHLDTVEPGQGIKPIIENGVIRSSSSTILGADNKVAVALILELIQTIVESEIDIPPLEIVFTLSEEIGNYGAVNLDYSLLTSKLGFSFDAGSPVGTIITASPFYNRFDVELIGKASHAGKPENGINALAIFAVASEKIKLGRLDENTVCNIGLVQGGSARNTVPGSISIKGEVRSYVEAELEEATKNVIHAFESSAESFGGSVDEEVVRENGGFKLSENDEAIRYSCDVIRGMNMDPVLIESSGCYDANIFHEHGIKVINFGDGSADNHTINEHIAVHDLVKVCDLAYNLVTTFDKR